MIDETKLIEKIKARKEYLQRQAARYDKKGIRTIYGMSGAESIPILENAINQLGDDASPDYWEPTEGNAKRALLQLLAMAKMRPDGIWDGD